MKRLLAALAAGLVLGGGTATAATYVITSINQIQPSVVNELRSISQMKVRYVSSPIQTYGPGQSANIYVSCPTGWTDLTGGFSVDAGVTVTESSEPSPGIWQVYATNNGFSNANIVGWAKCVPGVA